MNESDDLVRQSPVLALGITAVVGAAAYASISVVMRQSVDPGEVGLFAVGFAIVYVVFARYSDTIEGYLGSE